MTRVAKEAKTKAMEEEFAMVRVAKEAKAITMDRGQGNGSGCGCGESSQGGQSIGD